MDIVAKYICLQYDAKNSNRNRDFSCPGTSPEVCIGISGYALNYGLCAFLDFYRPISGDNFEYGIKWNSVARIIFPVVFQLNTATQFVGTRVNKPGLLKYENIGRRQCTQQKERLFLKLEEPCENLEKHLIRLESDI